MTDREIIEGLIARDGKITRKFFYVKCRPLMYSIIGRVFAFDIDNPRYRLVLQKSLIEDMAPEALAKQMGVTVANSWQHSLTGM